MIINTANLDALHVGFGKAFNQGLETAPTAYSEIALTVPSMNSENLYAWLGQFPGLREWLGERRVKSLVAHGYTIKNKLFESSIAVPRTAIEDDNYGLYSPLMRELGRAAGENPDKLVFDTLSAGFDAAGYDGQNFFDTAHPQDMTASDSPVVSNMQAGSGPAWFLLDTSRAIKPLIYQSRFEPELAAVEKSNDKHVFMKDEYLYGVRARGNAGFGLWQLAFGSKAALSSDNYRDARKAMAGLKGDEGRPLGIRPDTLVCSPELEEEALQLINAERTADDTSNVWKGTAKLIITPWLG